MNAYLEYHFEKKAPAKIEVGNAPFGSNLDYACGYALYAMADSSFIKHILVFEEGTPEWKAKVIRTEDNSGLSNFPTLKIETIVSGNRRKNNSEWPSDAICSDRRR